MRHFLSSILSPILTTSAIVIPIGIASLFTQTSTAADTPQTIVPTIIQIAVQSSNDQANEEQQFLEVPQELATYIKHIKKNSSDILEIELTTNQFALMSNNSESQPIELKRLLAIIQGFQFDTIKEKIVEIDVRYKLPVLRTNKSSEQIQSEFTNTSENVKAEQSDTQNQINQIEVHDNNESSIMATQAAIQEQ